MPAKAKSYLKAITELTGAKLTIASTGPAREQTMFLCDLLTTEGTEITEMNNIPEEYKALTESIIGAAIDVHRALGPGLLESCYSACLAYELSARNILFRKEVDLPVVYNNVKLECGYRMDFVVADAVLLELKAVDEITSLHESQILSYLKLSGLRVGLLLNFNVSFLRDGIVRRVL